MKRTPPTCTKSFGHQPFKAYSDFSFIKVVIIEGFYGRNNESLFTVVGLTQIAHDRGGLVGSSRAVGAITMTSFPKNPIKRFTVYT